MPTSAAYGYDDKGRKTSESVDHGAFTLGSTTTYYRNDLQKSFTGPNGIAYNYTYDMGNRLSGIQIPGAGQVSYNTYLVDQPLLATLPGGSRVSWKIGRAHV